MSRNERRYTRSLSRERELERKRREWKIEQRRAREHERRKQKMIRDYEERRARELGLNKSDRSITSQKRRSNRSESHYSTTSSSCSPPTRSRDNSKTESQEKKKLLTAEKLDSTSTSTKLFKCPDGTEISISDLKKIKIDIRRNITTPEKTKEQQRNIIDLQDFVLKRRDGEGKTPIFDREELKPPEKPNEKEEEEHQRVVTIEPTANSSRRSSLSEERRRRIRSPQRDSRHETSSRSVNERSDHFRRSEHSKERISNVRDEVRSRDRRSPREHRSSSSYSRERRRRRSSSEERYDRRRSRRESSRYERDHYDDRNRHYKDDEMRSRRMMELQPHYLQPVPVPFYYENYGRPILVNPMMPMRGPISMGRGRMPPIMNIARPPYPPRFIPPVVFRPRGPPNPRY